MKAEVIDQRQVLALLIITFVSEGLLFAPSVTFLLARQDAWMSNIIALAGGLFSAWSWVALSSRFPGKTLFQVFPIIFGRYFGLIMAVFYIWGWFSFACDTMREITGLLVAGFMPRTPIVVFIIIFALLSTYMAHNRLENLGRVSLIFFPFILGVVVILFILSTGEMNLSNLTPVFENGIIPVVKGSLTPMIWFAQVIEISALLPFLDKSGGVLRTCSKSIIISFFVFELVSFGIMAILGPSLSAHTLAPVLYGARMIHLAGFLERTEFLIIFVWIAGSIIKIALYQWTVSLGTAQLIGMKDYQSLVIPFGILLICFSFLLHPSMVHFYNFVGYVWSGPYGLGYLVLSPFIFLLWAVVTGKGSKS